VLPARPYKPHDKAVVENAVRVAQRWIVAALRNRKFFSLVDANQAVGELLHRLNHRPFRKRDGSRASVFEALDKPALQPLPQERFEIGEWEQARVNIDYHVAFDANFYSVPYNLSPPAVNRKYLVQTTQLPVVDTFRTWCATNAAFLLEAIPIRAGGLPATARWRSHRSSSSTRVFKEIGKPANR
jgi:hypothetical protein